jgi:hypothetical protein
MLGRDLPTSGTSTVSLNFVVFNEETKRNFPTASCYLFN